MDHARARERVAGVPGSSDHLPEVGWRAVQGQTDSHDRRRSCSAPWVAVPIRCSLRRVHTRSFVHRPEAETIRGAKEYNFITQPRASRKIVGGIRDYVQHDGARSAQRHS